jgi:hypothetical protein
MPKWTITLAACLLAPLAPALAHSKSEHQAKHGGIVVESGHHHLEIVVGDGTIELHVEDDDGNAEDVSGAKATAVVLSGGEKFDVTFKPEPSNMLKASGEFKKMQGTTVVITLTMPDHKPEQVRIKLD